MNDNESTKFYKSVVYYATSLNKTKEEFYATFGNLSIIRHSAVASASHHRIDHFEYLIKQGYNMNEYDGNGHTMLYYIGVSYDLDRLKIILDNGIDVNKRSKSVDDAFRGTILHNIVYVCYCNEKHIKNMRERLDMLLSHGADPKIKNGKGQNVIAYVKYWIRIVKQRKCRCQHYTDKPWGQHYYCWNCRKVDDLNGIIECIQNHEKKTKTLFELMLPSIKNYRISKTKRQRKK